MHLILRCNEPLTPASTFSATLAKLLVLVQGHYVSRITTIGLISPTFYAPVLSRSFLLASKILVSFSVGSLRSHFVFFPSEYLCHEPNNTKGCLRPLSYSRYIDSSELSLLDITCHFFLQVDPKQTYGIVRQPALRRMLVYGLLAKLLQTFVR